MPSVPKASPSAIRSSQFCAHSRSPAPARRRTAPSCCERINAAVRLPSAIRAYRWRSSVRSHSVPRHLAGRDHEVTCCSHSADQRSAGQIPASSAGPSSAASRSVSSVNSRSLGSCWRSDQSGISEGVRLIKRRLARSIPGTKDSHRQIDQTLRSGRVGQVTTAGAAPLR